MEWLNKLLRPEIKTLKPYSTARNETGGFRAEIAIDANESPWPPFGNLGTLCRGNRYPEPQPENLLQRLSAVWGVRPEQLMLGRGSSDGIDALLRAFCRPTIDSIIICPPTFGLYEIDALIQGAKTVKVALNASWQLDVPGILSACNNTTKLIYIPSPNAPMGHAMLEGDVVELLDARKEKSIVVIDEAYIEFTDKPDGLIPLLAKYPHLVITRTLSKAYALAGERIGAVLGHPEILTQLHKVRAIYPLTQSSIMVALDALSANGLMESAEHRRILSVERSRMLELLPHSLFIDEVFPSVANFILVRAKDCKILMDQLKKFGILARDMNGSFENAIRITVSTPEENNLVLRALGVAVNEQVKNERIFSKQRVTKETAIAATVNLDATNFLEVDSGIGFFDHMLAQLASHGGFGLVLTCRGDLNIDQHHTVEDCALTLGAALGAALGDKKGLTRFGFDAPLDEALARVVIDLSGRPYAQFDGVLTSPTVGGLTSEMVPHFFQSLANTLGASIHIHVQGTNNHHMVEACFKAVGRALRQAFRREGDILPSTKGVL